MSGHLQTSVAFIIFRRPETTRRVFEAIRAVQPPQLYVIADGPRTPEEAALVARTRAIIDEVDWPCEVHKNYAKTNMGLKQRVSSGLDWVFEQVEEAIILEDDCVPDPTFFRFCEELLTYYRDEPSVMMISGQSFGHNPAFSSYYFSRFVFIWGWATWRRAWEQFRLECKDVWLSTRDTTLLEEVLEIKELVAFWYARLNEAFLEDIDAWSYSWLYAIWRSNGFSIVPKRNLVSNTGFGLDAVHTRDRHSTLANLPTGPIDFPLKHPSSIEWDKQADLSVFSQVYRQKNGFLNRFLNLVRRTKRILNSNDFGSF